MTEQYRQPPTAKSRKTRASLATLGLAISMGAAGALLPRQGDSAVATEPAAAAPNLAPEAGDLSTSFSAVATLDQAASTTLTSGVPVITAAAPDLNDPAVSNASAFLGQLKQERNRLARSIESLDQTYAPASVNLNEDQRNATAASPNSPHPSPFKLEDASNQRRPLSVLGSSPAVKPDSAKVTANPETSPRVKQSLAPGSLPFALLSDRSADLGLGVTYRVQPGDTLAGIAARHGLSVRALILANAITDPGRLQVGQSLTLPQGVIATSPATPSLAEGGWEQSSLAQIEPGPAVVGTRTTPRPLAVSPSVPPSQPQAAIPAPATPMATPSLVERPEPAATAPQPASLPAKADLTRPANRDLASQGSANPGSANPGSANQANASQINYVDRLRDEIRALRERYGSEASEPALMAAAPQPAAAAVTNRNSLTVAPPAAPPVQAPEGSLAQATQATRSPVAITPRRWQADDPRLQPLLGRNVSPQLPPLGDARAYLPGSGDRFRNRVATNYIWPSTGTLTSGYGWRWGRMHRGIDIAAPVGTPVVAAAEGTVTSAGWNNGGYGNLVEIRHADGSITRYAHNSRLLVRPGQQVSQGELISEMGSTGRSTGPHLHFEVHPGGNSAVNPMAFLPSGGLRASR